jgi:hypothetical protein
MLQAIIDGNLQDFIKLTTFDYANLNKEYINACVMHDRKDILNYIISKISGYDPYIWDSAIKYGKNEYIDLYEVSTLFASTLIFAIDYKNTEGFKKIIKKTVIDPKTSNKLNFNEFVRVVPNIITLLAAVGDIDTIKFVVECLDHNAVLTRLHRAIKTALEKQVTLLHQAIKTAVEKQTTLPTGIGGSYLEIVEYLSRFSLICFDEILDILIDIFTNKNMSDYNAMLPILNIIRSNQENYDYTRSINKACTVGNLNCLIPLFQEQYGDFLNKVTDFTSYNNAMSLAAKNGHMNIVKYMVDARIEHDRAIQKPVDKESQVLVA